MPFYFPLPTNERKSKVSFDCNKCGLKKHNIQSPEMKAYIGDQYDGLVILGQFPSKEDDEKGYPFADSRSKILRSTGIKAKLNLAKHAAFLHVASCYNPTKKKTNDSHLKCCFQNLDRQLKELKPKVIICCGEMAFKYLFELNTKTSISKLRNRIIPNYQYNCLVFPVYDPYDRSMYNNDELSYHYAHTYKWDLERIYKAWNKNLHKRTIVNQILKERKILNNITIEEITSFKRAKELFSLWNRMQSICLDYETTNLFPYDEYFEIVYIAFGNKTNAWVFHEDFWNQTPIAKEWFKKQMKRIIHNSKVKKIIQNDKFEDLCSRWVYGTNGINNSFCTMVATHTIDEREGCTSLDFQNLVRFGIPPYNSAIKKYITTGKKSIEIDLEDEEGESIEETDDVSYTFQKVNKIREAPKEDMIQYNGLDVITCYNNYLLFEKDLFDMYPNAKDNYQFLHDGHRLFADMSQRGINIGKSELNEFEGFLDLEIEKLENKIELLPEIIEFNKVLESKSPKAKKKKSDEDLKDLCFKKPEKIRLNRKIAF